MLVHQPKTRNLHSGLVEICSYQPLDQLVSWKINLLQLDNLGVFCTSLGAIVVSNTPSWKRPQVLTSLSLIKGSGRETPQICHLGVFHTTNSSCFDTLILRKCHSMPDNPNSLAFCRFFFFWPCFIVLTSALPSIQKSQC